MGYTTEFQGEIYIEPSLDPTLVEYINRFADSRRMKRNLEELLRCYPEVENYGLHLPSGPTYGVEGEYFCLSSNYEGDLETIDDYNYPPVTQPGLWCQWNISDDGSCIFWDGGEKFYSSPLWMMYVINNFIAPFGHVCNGIITAQGDDISDVWSLIVKDNVVSIIDPIDGIDAFDDMLIEINSIINDMAYHIHLEELLNKATKEQLEFITETRRRLADVYGRYKGFVEN